MFLALRMSVLTALIAIFVFIIYMLRSQKLDLKYCLVWIIGLLGIAAICAFPQVLTGLSGLLGIETPVNALFLICIAFLACICISLTIAVSRLSSKLRQLTQNIAIKEFEQNGDIERNKPGQEEGE